MTLFIYFFILGIIVGSFLNVVILRHNTGKTTGGRSSCMSCKTQLTWRQLVPILSFVFQRGRCATCRTKLSWQYPLVELATGLLFAANFYLLFHQAVSVTQLIISVGLSSCILALMIVIFVYDVRHKIIPDVFSLTAWGLSVVWVLSSLFMSNTSALADTVNTQVYRAWIPAFAGMTSLGSGMTSVGAGLLFYFIIWSIWKLSKGRMIGLGDAKLLLSIGTILGLVYGLSSIILGVWIGTAYAMYILLKQKLSNVGKHITMKTEIPFGPFLIIGFLIVYFFNIDVTNIHIILENFS